MPRLRGAAEILGRLNAPLKTVCCNHDTDDEMVRGTTFARHFGERWFHVIEDGQCCVAVIGGNVDWPGEPALPPLEDDDEKPWRVGQGLVGAVARPDFQRG